MASPPGIEPIRILIIGAGQRGTAYAHGVSQLGTYGIVTAVAEPVDSKREAFHEKYIAPNVVEDPLNPTEFITWQDWVVWESIRRRRKAAREANVPDGVHAAFICTMDDTHADIVCQIAALGGVHVMCEKPMATNFADCLRMMTAWTDMPRKTVFGIGHVLRYSPHNMELRRLVVDENVIGDVLSIEHTEPVGHWHFAHSYVRGNWRREDTSGPSLLTKSCHDIDFILWLLSGSSGSEPHHPSKVFSTGSLSQFRPSRKPTAAGAATNCLSCPIEESCIYSAKRIYLTEQFDKGNTSWPVNIVCPDIEEYTVQHGPDSARQNLLRILSEDYDASTPSSKILSRTWYGRCVWASDNTVLDDQVVLLSWDGDGNEDGDSRPSPSKSATFHMVSSTEKQCERRGRIYGTAGEIEYDSETIRIYDFRTRTRRVVRPKITGETIGHAHGHGGGDNGLAGQFVKAVYRVEREGCAVDVAQREELGVTIEEAVRSHGVVFAAEQARREGRVVDWKKWWDGAVKHE